MRILITGSNGFIGKNLYQYLLEIPHIEIFTFTRNEEPSKLLSIIEKVDFVFHLAGVNRPKVPDDFIATNVHFTKSLIELIKIETSTKKRKIGFVFASSTQAELQNPYGESKKKAEDILIDHQFNDIFFFIYRLPNVFGKWALPNYNSVVATFCHNIANNLDIKVDNPDAQINLLYIEDLILSFGRLLDEFQSNNATPNYSFIDLHDSIFTIKLAELASLITSFKNSRISLESERVGKGLIRALYSTYISYLPVDTFKYKVPKYIDNRGIFVEFLKTPDCGQFSYFTANPGVTRGGHYHHSKTEKFLVVKGQALFRFRNIITKEFFELSTTSDFPEIVETVPGWAHDITNVGTDEMIVMLWANENFNKERPDTFKFEVINKEVL